MADGHQESIERRQYIDSLLDEGGSAFATDTGTLMLNDETPNWVEFARDHETDTTALILVDIGIDEISRLYLDWKSLRDLVIVATGRYTELNLEPTGLYNFEHLETLDIRVPEEVSITGTSTNLVIRPDAFNLFEFSAPLDYVDITSIPHGLTLLDLSTKSGTIRPRFQRQRRSGPEPRYSDDYDVFADLHTLRIRDVTQKDITNIKRIATDLIESQFIKK